MTYYGKHTSMSQWVKAAKLSWADDLISEDATKRDRLRILERVAGFPVTPSFSFSYEQITSAGPDFDSFLHRAGGADPYALRLNPSAPGLEVIRNRNLTVAELVDWALTLDTDLQSYEFTFEPHIVSVQAAILVVSEEGAAGEAANGGILDLNSGTNAEVVSYVFNYRDALEIETDCPADLAAFVERVLRLMTVSSGAARKELSDLLEVSFQGDMARGYYEAISDARGSIWFIDFNRVLETPLSFMMRTAAPNLDSGTRALTGHAGCTGYAEGRARLLVPGVAVTADDIEPGDVLICRLTEPEHIPLIKTASAVVTDFGGVLSHAAIVARELGKPCVVGTRTATSEIREGDFVEVRATEGTVIVRRVTGVDHAGR